jgi:acyl-CoA thioesterase YciA
MNLITQKICMTRDLGIHGNLFGGNMLSWIDEAAASMAADVCNTPNMVTVKIDEVVFKRPVKLGYQLLIYGEVVTLGNTSITMKIEARKRNFYGGEEVVVCTTNITFVRIDDEGNAVPIAAEVRKKLDYLKAAAVA